MATAIDSATDTTAAVQQPAARPRVAKATQNKRESILFRIKLQDATGKHVPVYEMANKMIGFFCSAGRYAVCQELAALTDRFLEANPNFTLIYVSLDTNEEAFNMTMRAHPRWLAIPYNEPVRIDVLTEWGTKGVPCLHIYDPIEHQILTSWGGSCLRFNFDRCMDDWKKGYQGVTWLQIVTGWWYYNAPVGVFRDMSDEELAVKGFPTVEDGNQNTLESKKDK
ncbi:hypothetical protein BGZ51_007504 [Haplosporangium sp. Z 767]|nr:hypothetical protein BGZ51_007504 [Haplosporangium sp. Z 767]KAF9194170.1 hypothetical protein BGZ50_006649 [Haplosporangium sp. Z 11]